MKKFLLLLVFSLVFFELYAQDWAPIGTKWYYSQATVNPNLQIYKIIESTGDTVFQNRNCRIMKETMGLPPFSYNSFLMYSSNDSIFYYDNLKNTFCLLYDFGAQPGDTIHVNTYNFDYIIDSVKILNYNGLNRKIQYISSNSLGYSMFDKNIEGIGNSVFMLPVADLFSTGPLRCFEDSFGLINFLPISCDSVFYTSIAENNDSEGIRFYVNKTGSKIIVEFSKPGFESSLINVYNGIGHKVVQNKGVNNSKIELPIENLTPGIYFIEWIHGQNQRVVKKIVI